MKLFQSKKTVKYNDRLFGSNFRGLLHRGRYDWIKRVTKRYGVKSESVVELGCFDGKAINFLPERPERYLGLDANWEGGLDIASELWKDFPEYEFRHCNQPKMMSLEGEVFDISLCLETLEHVPGEMVAPYLKNLASSTSELTLISVPNEIGPVFLMKHLFKSLVGEGEPYTFPEILSQSIGRVDRVSRDQHKGFSWKEFEKQVSNHFDILSVDGISPSITGPYLSFGVGFVGKPKK
jgi:SAM-dependent methyltransferase